jgi:hypothetical protein
MKCQHCGSEVFFLSVASGEPRFCCTRCGQTHFHKPADVVGRFDPASSTQSSTGADEQPQENIERQRRAS